MNHCGNCKEATTVKDDRYWCPKCEEELKRKLEVSLKPVKHIPDRAKTKYELRQPELAKYIRVPGKRTQTTVDRLLDYAPYIILRYGSGKLRQLADALSLPLLSTILKLTAKGISMAAKRFSVEEK